MSENKSYHNIFKHIRKVIRIIITVLLKESETDIIKVAEEDAKEEDVAWDNLYHIHILIFQPTFFEANYSNN